MTAWCKLLAVSLFPFVMSDFRVMQFNMQFGQTWDAAAPDTAPVSLDATLAEIRKHNADIVLLQEVEHAVALEGQAPFTPNFNRLKEELDHEYHFFFELPKPDPRELPFGVGLAILSRTPLTEMLRVDIPSPPIHFDFNGEDKTPTDRLLIGASTLIGGHMVKIYNTHLLAFFMLNSSSGDHPLQRTMVANILRSEKGAAFVGGDFNVSHHQSLVEQMAEAGCETVQQSLVTWRRRPYILDHIFYNRHLLCENHAVVPTPASDHHLLVADFRIR